MGKAKRLSEKEQGEIDALSKMGLSQRAIGKR